MLVNVKTLDSLFADYDQNKQPKNTYEYYSASSRLLLATVNDKDKKTAMTDLPPKIIKSPALTFDKKYPLIEKEVSSNSSDNPENNSN